MYIEVFDTIFGGVQNKRRWGGGKKNKTNHSKHSGWCKIMHIDTVEELTKLIYSLNHHKKKSRGGVVLTKQSVTWLRMDKVT